MDDDFEIEITDLRAEQAGQAGNPYALPRPLRLTNTVSTVSPTDAAHGSPNGITQAPMAQSAAHATPDSQEENAGDVGDASSVPSSSTQHTGPALPPDETFELEVTDLSGQTVHSLGWLASATTQGNAPHAIVARMRRLIQPPAGTAALAHGAAARQVDRRRMVGGVAALVAVVTALLVVLSGSTVPRVLVSHLFATPTATTVGANTILLTHTVPWGVLRIDGKVVAPSAYGNVALVNLSGGQHQLRYDGPPFPPLSCHLSVPAQASDTCPQGSQSLGQPLDTFGAARLLDMGAAVSKLSPKQVAQLTQVVQGLFTSLTTTTAVAPGDHYVAASGAIVSASQALQAAFTPVLNTDPNDAPNVNGIVCVSFCESQGGYGNGFSDTGWTVLVNVRTEWDITAPDGTIISIAKATIPDAPPNASLLSVPVALTWTTGHWQLGTQAVTGLADPPGFDVRNLTLCNTAGQLIPIAITSSTTNSTSSTNGTPNGGARSSCAVAQDPADGCVIVWQSTDPNGSPVGPPAYLLYRFGVLLAANRAALRAFSTLPGANGREQALAQQIVASLGPAAFGQVP